MIWDNHREKMESTIGSVVEHRVKTVLLGDSGVGKTSFIECFKNGPRESKTAFVTTTGPEYVSHKFEIDGVVLKVNIWDTAGQEAYRALNRTFYREAKGGLIAVDMSVPPKIDSLEYWYKEFTAYADPKCQVIIIGNKADLEKDPETITVLEEFAQSKQIPFFEVSALTGINVDMAMHELMSLITQKYYKDPDNPSNSPLYPKRQIQNVESVRLSYATIMTDKSSGSTSSCCPKI